MQTKPLAFTCLVTLALAMAGCTSEVVTRAQAPASDEAGQGSAGLPARD